MKARYRDSCGGDVNSPPFFLFYVDFVKCFLTYSKFIYGLETVVSVLFSNTRTRLLYNEREIFNTARSEAECSIENFEFIVQ